MTTPDRPRVKATATSFAILEAVRDRDGAGVTELARELDLAKSAVYKHLMTLTRLGYLVKEDTTYYLSLTFQGFGTRARERYPIYIAEPAIDNLAGTTGNVVNFMIYENGQGIYAYQARAPTAAEPPIPEYTHVPLHATAGGKAILAYLPAEERERAIADGLTSFTEKTITDRDELEDELQSVRDRRTAFEREEFTEGYQCVGSPIIGSNAQPVGAVSVSGSTAEMTGKRLEEDMTGLVVSTAKSIENETLSE
ncbi:IclR family transcriptional regulator (plasmid) [Halococcus dombrowskii]|uniref:IclR family transcriptional regulator n=1 Tax=Halococcus dombrowskii TaxID=179637 RepID=A0AAV3SER5_HALDO|nr:IclR family transcriptional regulator [Halococcus dombrowskii]UOO96650.1 IclR family transcriptional regulator [Halococcus dombrowskii]